MRHTLYQVEECEVLEKEIYDSILEDLAEEIRNTSDLLTVQAHPYETFITSSGKIDNRKKYFSIKFVILTYNIGALRFSQIMTDIFQRMSNWIERQENIYFMISDMKSITSGDTPRIEIEIKFDDMIDISKRLLIKG